ELNKFIESALKDDSFIGEACLPLLKGGKRLRPLLFFICAKSRDNFSLERTLPLAAAIELIHTASLVHDDILDQSKIRRGIATSNAKYGAQIAVLIGDYLFAKAFQLVAEGNYGDEVSLVLSKLVRDLCIGEITQDRSLFKVPTMTEYYYKIRMKTAIFLASCCRLGGIVAELNKDEVESLTDYGINLGLAFQITDDLLDFFGDTNVTGKALGGDLKSGVITLPVIHALEVSHKSETLRKIVTKQNLSDNDIAEAIGIIKETDSVEYCKTRAYTHINAAGINLSDLINNSIVQLLEKIASFVVNRTW
ncbi:MAG: polyprenyl synthetase family protein, partial [Selenomonadaceae bacterium]|nr:polyprenyl synthetase family protein [Selenomonadaceae bacterium]